MRQLNLAYKEDVRDESALSCGDRATSSPHLQVLGSLSGAVLGVLDVEVLDLDQFYTDTAFEALLKVLLKLDVGPVLLHLRLYSVELVHISRHHHPGDSFLEASHLSHYVAVRRVHLLKLGHSMRFGS